MGVVSKAKTLAELTMLPTIAYGSFVFVITVGSFTISKNKFTSIMFPCSLLFMMVATMAEMTTTSTPNVVTSFEIATFGLASFSAFLSVQ